MEQQMEHDDQKDEYEEEKQFVMQDDGNGED